MYAAVVPSNLDQNEQSVFRPKMPKNPTFWGVHTYLAYIRSTPAPPPPVLTTFMVVRDRDEI